MVEAEVQMAEKMAKFVEIGFGQNLKKIPKNVIFLEEM
jgi:hypothetical protein